MKTCICRTDPRGRRWINVSCRKHGLRSAADEPDTETRRLGLDDEPTLYPNGTNW